MLELQSCGLLAVPCHGTDCTIRILPLGNYFCCLCQHPWPVLSMNLLILALQCMQVKLAEGWQQAGNQTEFNTCIHNVLETNVRLDEENKGAGVRPVAI